MKYIAQGNGQYVVVDEFSDDYATLKALPEDCKPTFLSESDAAVKAYLAAQAEEANLAQDQAIEREAIDEVIREQFSKQIAERIAQKKTDSTKRKNAK